MNILVINGGSSSLKFSIFEAAVEAEPKLVLDGEVSGIGGSQPTLELRQASGPGSSVKVTARSSADAIHLVLDELSKSGIPAMGAIGYRVVHPGPRLDRHQRITDEVLAELEAAVAFAPLHDPGAIRLIREAMGRFPNLPHYACFDTVFHQTMPPESTTYPIPLAFRDEGVRRYGFHGLSCESIVRQLRITSDIPFPKRLIIAHLGSGCSITSCLNGESADTTMGLTPTGGIIMGTRPGDLDPGLIFYLLRQPGATVDSVEHMLNHDAGLKALGGDNDLRNLRKAQAAGDARATLTLAIFSQSIRRALGGMVALHGVDAIVFTGGIGEHDQEIHSLAQNLAGNQKVPVYILPAQEDLIIALHVARMAASD